MVGGPTSAFRILVVLAAAATCCVLTAGADAAKPDPGDSSGVSQYVEQLPTSSGSVAAGRAAKAPQLSPRIHRSVRAQGGSDSKVLGDIAGSPALGAPKPESKNPAANPSRVARPVATRSTADDGGSHAVLWLVLGLVVLTGAASAVALKRRF